VEVQRHALITSVLDERMWSVSCLTGFNLVGRTSFLHDRLLLYPRDAFDSLEE